MQVYKNDKVNETFHRNSLFSIDYYFRFIRQFKNNENIQIIIFDTLSTYLY